MEFWRNVARPGRRATMAMLLLAAAGGALFPSVANAGTTCAPTAAPGIERCVSGLSAASQSRIYQAQRASNWCWAASVAMILGRYGLAVPQEQVVRELLGGMANERASARAMAGLLSRAWSDAAGRAAVARSEPLAPWRRALGVAAPEVLEDLGRDKPLLLGVEQHAMVLVQVTYERRTDGRALTPAGVRVLRALVLDPASGNWLRSLQPQEHQPEFLARVDVDLRRPAAALTLAQSAGPRLQ